MTNTTFDPSTLSAGCALSNGNLTALSSQASSTGARSVDGVYSGQFYIEFSADVFSSASSLVGFGGAQATYAALGSGTGGFLVTKNGFVYVASGGYKASIGTFTNGAILCFAIDLINLRGWVRLGASGLWNGSSSGDPTVPATGLDLSGLFGVTNPAHPCAIFNASGDQATGNFGGSAFVGAVPAGYTSGLPAGTAINLLASQVGAEVWGNSTSPPLRVSQVGAEVWGSNNAALLMISQVGAEVWINLAAAPYVPPRGAMGIIMA